MKNNKESIIFRYDGEALKGKSINVIDLAPALLSLAELCKDANVYLNRDKTNLNILVNADIRQNCFELKIEFIQNFYEQIKLLISNPEIKNVKDILEWVGILARPVAIVGGSITSVLLFLKWLNGRKLSDVEQITKADKNNNITLKTIDGKNTININNNVYNYVKESDCIDKIKIITKPLIQEGYDKLEFEHKGKKQEIINKEEAIQINNIQFPEEVHLENQIVKAYVSVYSPVYDKRIPKWRFYYGDSKIYIDISQTSIAEDAIARGGALINDNYHLELEIQQTLDNKNKIKNNYIAKKVISFTRTQQQRNLFNES